ncbi:MAG: HAD-IIB family hydrolase [Cyanobacteria bacterium NC_groundwater_1444_Ag_S-0.65um_54_12]|nr:HAD-IIB family hydrolase [Cyanobacteria bacterium NC_groundwater_1444_Ag_S-0.65um_54_12]
MSIQKHFSKILVTDLDGTLIGEGNAMRSLLSWCYARQDMLVVYNTARTWASARSLLNELALPWPDSLVTGIGTEIRHGWGKEPDPVWTHRIAARWDRRAVEQIAAGIGHGIAMQPSLAQSTFKVSFEIENPAVARKFFSGVRKARLWVHGLLTDDRWLDVIPFRAGKGVAAAYLRVRYGILPVNMLVSGDSENDFGMLSRLGPAVVVGNASRSLVERLSTVVYRARLPAAAGIWEGLQHFGWC